MPKRPGLANASKKEMQMIVFRVVLGFIWGAVLSLATYGSFQGGDVSILSGYVFLLLTLPFGVVWAFAIIPLAGGMMNASQNEQIVAMALIDILTLAFWLIGVPLLWRRYGEKVISHLP